MIQKLAHDVGLINAINEQLRVLKLHNPYHESDHVMTFAFGRDHFVRQAFYGIRLHLCTSNEGIIQAAVLAAANEPETQLVWELDPGVGKLGIGDRGYLVAQHARTTAQIRDLVIGSFQERKERPDAGGLQAYAESALADRDRQPSTGRSISRQKDVGQRPLAFSSPDDT